MPIMWPKVWLFLVIVAILIICQQSCSSSDVLAELDGVQTIKGASHAMVYSYGNGVYQFVFQPGDISVVLSDFIAKNPNLSVKSAAPTGVKTGSGWYYLVICDEKKGGD